MSDIFVKISVCVESESVACIAVSSVLLIEASLTEFCSDNNNNSKPLQQFNISSSNSIGCIGKCKRFDHL
jgi:hypothetical protein